MNCVGHFKILRLSTNAFGLYTSLRDTRRFVLKRVLKPFVQSRSRNKLPTFFHLFEQLKDLYLNGHVVGS